MSGNLLEVTNLTMQFGGVTALDNVSLSIPTGEILGLIGPNGAGKTTCFNVITRCGIARTFQNIRLFPEMSALENVMVGIDTHHRSGVFDAIMRTARLRAEERHGRERAMELLEFMGIAAYADVAARNLPYGYQRRLEIARALGTEPRLLCLDEPAAGFNPAETEELNEIIFKIRDQGYTVLLIEHDMNVVMKVSNHVVVLDFGRKIAEGTPDEVRKDPAVIAAYLGVDDAS